MGYLVAGIIILAGTIGLLWISLPNKTGQLKPFLRNGMDAWVAVAITSGVGLGLGGIVAGVVELSGLL